MPTVRMYSTHICPFCIRAEHLLHSKGIAIEKIMVDHAPEQMQKMIEMTGRRTVPQIFINDYHVGGYDDLAKLEMEGELDPLLAAN